MDECIMTLALGLRDSEVDDGTVDAWRTLPVPTQARPTTNWFGLLDQVGRNVRRNISSETVGITDLVVGSKPTTPLKPARISQSSPLFPSGQAETHWYRGGTFQPTTHAPLQKDPVHYWYTVAIHSPEITL